MNRAYAEKSILAIKNSEIVNIQAHVEKDDRQKRLFRMKNQKKTEEFLYIHVKGWYNMQYVI